MTRGLTSCTRLILPDSFQLVHPASLLPDGALRAGRLPALLAACLLVLVLLLLSADAMAAQIVSTWTFGGSKTDSGTDILLTDDGCILVAGTTKSPDFPMRPESSGTSYDVYVAKFSRSGEQRWACLLGGSADDGIGGMVQDGDGAIWVAGSTASDDLPTPGGFDTTFGGGGYSDAFIAKISPDGELLFGTYLGGCGRDYATGIATDWAGNVIVIGSTDSGDFLLPDGQPVVFATTDIFVIKFAPDYQMEWARRIGGLDRDYTSSVVADSEENILIGGYTYSPDFPFTQGQWAGESTSFLLKLSPSGESLWTAALGRNLDFVPLALAVDSANNIVIAGGWYDAIVRKINAGGELQWAITIAASGSAKGIVVAPDDSIIVCGTTSSFPAPVNMSERYDGYGFIAKLSPTKQLLCRGVIGERETHYGSDVALDSSGRAWLVGSPRDHGDVAVVQFTFESQLTVQSTPITGVEIGGDYPGVTNYSSFCQFGQVATLQAPAFSPSGGANYRFVRWTLDGADQPDGQTALQIPMGSNHVAMARYEARSLCVKSSPASGIDITGDKPGRTAYYPMCDVDQEVTLTAPETALTGGYDLHFAHWMVDSVDQPQGERVVHFKMDKARVVTAVYDAVRCELSVSAYPGWILTAEITGDRPGTTSPLTLNSREDGTSSAWRR